MSSDIAALPLNRKGAHALSNGAPPTSEGRLGQVKLDDTHLLMFSVFKGDCNTEMKTLYHLF